MEMESISRKKVEIPDKVLQWIRNAIAEGMVSGVYNDDDNGTVIKWHIQLEIERSGYGQTKQEGRA